MKAFLTFACLTVCSVLTACGQGSASANGKADAAPPKSAPTASPEPAEADAEAVKTTAGSVAPPANAAMSPASQSAAETNGQQGSTAPPAASPAAPELDVANMALAKQVGKASVPVDVRYQVSGPVAKDQSASVQLAFIPRVEGSAMRVEFPRSESISVSETKELMVNKALPASVHRHNLLVTPLKGDSGELRAIVSMDVAGGRHFGIFVIPVASRAR
jgi:hypothetical protein